MDTPPVDTPLDTPPVDTPPVDTPPVDTPPVDTPPVDTPPVDTPPAGDWRNDMLGAAGIEGDDAEKRLNILSRYTDQAAMTKAFFEQYDKIRSGQIETGLPENPSDEQLAAYREANGIPAEVGGYIDGLELSEAEVDSLQPLIDNAHANNMSKEAFTNMFEAFIARDEAAVQARQTQDGLDSQNAINMMKEQWGPDYQTNINMINNMVNRLPETVRDAFKNARMADGRGLLNSPEILQFLADIERKVNPQSALIPSSANPSADIHAEIAELEARMGEPGWHSDVAANKRIDQLYELRAQMEGN